MRPAQTGFSGRIIMRPYDTTAPVAPRSSTHQMWISCGLNLPLPQYLWLFNGWISANPACQRLAFRIGWQVVMCFKVKPLFLNFIPKTKHDHSI